MRSIDYSDEAWRESVGHLPLRVISDEDLALLHRHWIWANQQREAFDAELNSRFGERDGAAIEGRDFGFMFAWYGMLWAVIEALTEPKEGRSVELRGHLSRDIERVRKALKRCRNAVLHVSRTGKYFDDRLSDLMSPENAITLRRIHGGLGRIFLEEFRRRSVQ